MRIRQARRARSHSAARFPELAMSDAESFRLCPEFAKEKNPRFMKPIEILLLSRNDILSLELTPQQVVDVVEMALAEHAAGT